MPGDSGVLVVTRVRSTTTRCTRDRGCSGHPAFPAPSQGRTRQEQPGRIAPRECTLTSTRHCEEHLRRSNPYLLCGPMDCFRLRSSSYGGQVASLAMTGGCLKSNPTTNTHVVPALSRDP